MLRAFLELIPVSIATAMSTVPMLATLSILLSANRTDTAVPFMVGFGSGLLALTTLFAVGFAFVPSTSVVAGTPLDLLEAGIGALVVGFALITFVKRRRPPAKPSIFASRIHRLNPITSIGFGFALNLRPKGILLAGAAGAIISNADQTFSTTVLLILASAAIGVSTVATPIMVTLARPQAMEPRLQAGQIWIAAHQATLSSAIMFLVGCFLLANAVFRN